MVTFKRDIFQCRGDAEVMPDSPHSHRIGTGIGSGCRQTPAWLHVGVCPSLLPSGGVCPSYGLHVHVGSCSALYQPLDWRPGEMGQRQPCRSLSLSLLLCAHVFFLFPSLSYSQVAPRIKTKHLRLSTAPAVAWIWVKPAKSISNALFPLLPLCLFFPFC